jgi:fluoroacetyl-CoA thioesterase
MDIKGISKESMVSVDECMCIDFLEGIKVLSTPSMLNAIEMLCRDMVKPYLQDGYDTVGSGVNLRHIAPTPVGMNIKIIANVRDVDGRRIEFSVEVYDDIEKVAMAVHDRYIINKERFIERARSKLNRSI